MEPEINIGDIVFSKKVDEKDLNVGDVITFSKDGMQVTHRIVNIEPDDNGRLRYTTKGDNNNTEDTGTVKYENILGKLAFKLPKLGYVVLAIQRNLYAVIAVFAFLAIFVITKPAKQPKEKKKNKDKKIEPLENKDNIENTKNENIVETTEKKEIVEQNIEKTNPENK